MGRPKPVPIDPALLTRAMKDSCSPASQISGDCPAVTMASAVELIRLASEGRVGYEDGRLVLNYGRRKAVKRG